MPSLRGAFVTAVLLASCRRSVSQADCETLVDRYVDIVVRTDLGDASPEVVARSRESVRAAAREEDVLQGCAAEIDRARYACAMSASDPDAFERCLQ